MKLSKLFTKTSKDNISDEVSANAQYLIRGGFIHKEIAGVYSFLPLGLIVLSKIENIIRKHMNAVSQEIVMSVLQPIENWETTDRLDVVDVLMKSTGANEKSKNKSTNEYILGPTHEELVTPLVQSFAKSYKDLPLCVYQIQSKFRNEARAKSGLLRGREFRMKDAYSFHVDKNDLNIYYENMKKVYMDIFDELGIGKDTYIAAASGGDFTDGFSHEFQTILSAGEDQIFIDPITNECYNLEVCPSQALDRDQDSILGEYQEVEGIGIIGVTELSKFLGIEEKSTTKTILFVADDQPIAVAIRGDYNINELKLKKILGCKDLCMMSDDEIITYTGAQVGYAGIVNLPDQFQIICDDSIQNRTNFECGANKTNYHCINVNRDRDLAKPKQFYDIKESKIGDINPNTGNIRKVENACEVGNIFPLNTKFSEAFSYYYTNIQNQKQIVYMGCYGIGPSRLMGVLVEKFHDDKGILRPKNIAPFQHIIICIGDTTELGYKYYEDLTQKGHDICIDDRDISPGNKFADAELIGIPWQIIISPKTLSQGQDIVELINRKSGEKKYISIYSIFR